MTLERTLQVRVSKDMERDLRRDAEQLGLTEAEGLRFGLQLLHRMAQRQRGLPALLAMAEVKGTDADRLGPLQ